VCGIVATGRLANSIRFGSVAGLTKKFNISGRIASSPRNGNNVVILQSISTTALYALTLVLPPNGYSDGFGYRLAMQSQLRRRVPGTNVVEFLLQSFEIYLLPGVRLLN
jgi:hypothetical protein